MLRIRQLIAGLLALSFFASSFASATGPCVRTLGAAQDLAAHTTTHFDSGSRADSGQQSAIVPDHVAHQTDIVHETESSDEDCPCCDGCESMCALSAFTPVALVGPPQAVTVRCGCARLSQVDALNLGPPPHVLFRPPILPVF